MNDWLKWFGSIVWQRSNDARVQAVKAEVEEIRADVKVLKERTAALEAFHKLAKDSE